MRNFYYLGGALKETSIRLGKSAPQFPNDLFTLCAWVKWEPDQEAHAQPENAVLFSYNDFSDSEQFPTDNENSLRIENLANLQVTFSGSTTKTGVSLADGAWHHIAITLDFKSGDDVRASVFKDGEAQGNHSVYRDEGQGLPPQSTLIFGTRNPDSLDQSFYGLVRHVQVWDRALTMDEVRTLMFEPVPGDPGTVQREGLRLWWPLDEAHVGKSVILDATANKNNGSIYPQAAVWKSATWVNFSDADFSDWQLPEDADFESAVLAKANFANCKLPRANLNDTDLKEAILNGTDLSGASMEGTDFSGASIGVGGPAFGSQPRFSVDPAKLTKFCGCRIDFAAIPLSSWSYLDLSGAVFQHIPKDCSNFTARHTVFPQGLDLSGIQLVNAELNGANLSHVIFKEANMEGADLSQTVLIGTRFEAANLAGCNFDGATSTDGENAAYFSGAYMFGTRMSNVTLNGSYFSNAHFYGSYTGKDKDGNEVTSKATLEGNTNLKNVHFESAVLNGMSFKDASIQYCFFAQVQLINSDFTGTAGAQLTNVDFTGAYLQGANFSNANLQEVNFTGALFSFGSDFLRIYEQDGTSYTYRWGPTLHDATRFANCTLPDSSGGPITSNVQLLGPLCFTDVSILSDLQAVPAPDPDRDDPTGGAVTISLSIRSQFEKRGYVLSSAAAIARISAANYWQINDTGNKRIFNIVYEDGIVYVCGTNPRTPYPPKPDFDPNGDPPPDFGEAAREIRAST
ncbi:MAG: pentapeptide repeat-containing protein [Bacillota bacterium]